MVNGCVLELLPAKLASPLYVAPSVCDPAGMACATKSPGPTGTGAPTFAPSRTNCTVPVGCAAPVTLEPTVAVAVVVPPYAGSDRFTVLSVTVDAAFVTLITTLADAVV